jgi:RNA polymerase sigma-70 factor (ECF subfamily)
VLAISTQAETSLISKAQQGDRGAYGELVRRYHAGVINVVYRLCGDARLAEDAAQEAFIRGWLHLPAYDQRSPLRNWLYKIAVNAALDALRRDAKVSPAELEELPLVAPEPDPETAAIQTERKHLVQRAIMALPPASRVVLVLREYEGLTYQEIASALEIPIGTVMSRLNFARHRLKEILAPQFLPVEVENG